MTDTANEDMTNKKEPCCWMQRKHGVDRLTCSGRIELVGTSLEHDGNIANEAQCQQQGGCYYDTQHKHYNRCYKVVD